MAVTPVVFLKPFLYSSGTGPNQVLIKVDRDIVQMHGFIETEVAQELVTLGLAASGPTYY